MSIDFTDVHRTRIRQVALNGEIYASTLDELGERAATEAAEFYGEQGFTIDGLAVEAIYAGTPRTIVAYRATYTARLNA